MRPFEYASPTTIQEALTLLGQDGSGATRVLVLPECAFPLLAEGRRTLPGPRWGEPVPCPLRRPPVLRGTSLRPCSLPPGARRRGGSAGEERRPDAQAVGVLRSALGGK